MSLCGFNESLGHKERRAFNKGKAGRPLPASFGVVSSDNRVSLWDVRTGTELQEFLTDNHLAAHSTCIAFGPPAGKEDVNRGYCAMGAENGSVTLWDLAAGKVLHALGGAGEGHTMRVGDVAFSADGKTLFTCGGDSLIIQWDVQTGRMERSWKGGSSPLTKIAVHPDGKTLLCGSQVGSVRSWDIATGKQLRKYSGHSSAVTVLAFFPGGSAFVSGSQVDRYVSVWATAGRKKKVKSPTLVLPMDSNPLSVAVATTAPGKFHVAAVCSTNIGYVWAPDALDDEKVDSVRLSPKAQVLLSKNAGAESTGNMLCASLGTRGGETVLLIARGPGFSPTFQVVEYFNSERSVFRAVTKLPALGSAELAVSASSGVKRKAAAAVASAASSLIPRLADAGDGKRKYRKAVLGERLPGVAARSKSRRQQSESLQVVLSQALRTDDDNLLEQCFSSIGQGNSDKVAAAVKATIERLPTPDVVPLLRVLIAKLSTKPSRAQQMVPWIREVLHMHLSFLLSLPREDLSGLLSPLYTCVDARLGVFMRLLELKGRLNLVLSQVNMVQASRERRSAVSKQPLNLYSEQPMEEEEVEDAPDESSADDGGSELGE